MAERGSQRRWRLALLWTLTAALGGYALLEGDDEAPPAAPAAPQEGPAEEKKLAIVEIVPSEANPGSAVVVRIEGADAKSPETLRVLVAKESAQIINRRGDQLVVRIPRAVEAGKAKVRVIQGDDRSKPYDLRVKVLNRRKLIRNVIGGLALLVFGLRTLSRGVRTYAGHRIRKVLRRLDRPSPAAVGLGVLVGGLTQLTTSAAGIVVGLLESRLLALGPAVAVLLGAQLGAAGALAVLPLASAREGLLVVAIGVAWISLAVDRRGDALGKAILGGGLLFYGLHVLRVGFQPLVADPEILPYIGYLDADSALGLLTCGAAGVLLAAILQGPGPVLVLVLGLAQSSGALDLASALAILAGTGFGAAIDTAIVAWPFGRKARRLAKAHALIGAMVTAIVLGTVQLWALLADTLVAGDPGELAYGKKILLPNMDEHMVVGFAASQLVATLLVGATLPWIVSLVQRKGRPSPEREGEAANGRSEAPASTRDLAGILRRHHKALRSVLELCRTGDRAQGASCEHALADGRAELDELFPGLTSAGAAAGTGGARAALATLQMQRALEDLLRLAERGIERNLTLTPRDDERVTALHVLLLEGIDALVENLDQGHTPDVEGARAREIRLNALESDGRRALLVALASEPDSTSARLHVAELLDAHENAGNHLYRLYETLAPELDEEPA